MQFTEEMDLALLNLVRENPVLYDHDHPKYIDLNTREVIWQKIGDELQRPATDCKVRWVNIRDVYRRILRRCITNPSQKIKAYKYDKELAFMKAYYKDAINIDFESDDRSNHDNDRYNDDSDDSNQPVIKSKRKRTKKGKQKRSKEVYQEPEKERCQIFEPNVQVGDVDPTDPVDAFLLSIGATLKTFSPYHLNLAKSKIFSVVQEHDLQQIMEDQRIDSSDVKVTTNDPIYLQK